MADPTLEIPARRTRARMEPFQIVLVFIAVMAASFLVGLLVATSVRPDLDDTVIAEGDVDAEGKTIRFDGGQVVVPPGATDRAVHIVIRRSSVTDRLRVAHRDQPIVIEPGELSAYRFGPTDVEFAKPVEITFRLPEDARNGTVFVRRGDEIDPLTGTIDPARGTATIRVRDFRFLG